MSMSEEHKRKIGEAQMGSKNHMFGKPAWNRGLDKSDSRVARYAETRNRNEKLKIKIIKPKIDIRVKSQEEIAGRQKPVICEVCGGGGRIMFDHCHKTGKFRGWICLHCNNTLGFARDNVEVLEKLIKYLKNN